MRREEKLLRIEKKKRKTVQNMGIKINTQKESTERERKKYKREGMSERE